MALKVLKFATQQESNPWVRWDQGPKNCVQDSNLQRQMLRCWRKSWDQRVSELAPDDSSSVSCRPGSSAKILTSAGKARKFLLPLWQQMTRSFSLKNWTEASVLWQDRQRTCYPIGLMKLRRVEKSCYLGRQT